MATTYTEGNVVEHDGRAPDEAVPDAPAAAPVAEPSVLNGPVRRQPRATPVKKMTHPRPKGTPKKAKKKGAR